MLDATVLEANVTLIASAGETGPLVRITSPTREGRGMDSTQGEPQTA